jgi:hypothetical protein
VIVYSALASFAVIAGLLTIIPGLDTALAVRAAVSHGRAAGFATSAGICSGTLAWGAAPDEADRLVGALRTGTGRCCWPGYAGDADRHQPHSRRRPDRLAASLPASGPVRHAAGETRTEPAADQPDLHGTDDLAASSGLA